MNVVLGSVLNGVASRLKQPSTYQGINLLLGSIGFAISPELSHLIASVGGVVAGAIFVIQNS